ncbi:MAG: hypothetical protein J0H12_06540 [Candidatus Paracaedimonas acanthamoebae]|uniref:Uncharacterized protein n=1 Tax=Candidatus Paracaedimonas acanthamoebae TaxID=244581 RepID=A0A8J7TU44_9PROT|nr:hypothetical protein [Candidatus Paracaedimonas acanthamoebae]
MRKLMYAQAVSFKLPRFDNDNKQPKKTYIPFEREFEQNFLKLSGIVF